MKKLLFVIAASAVFVAMASGQGSKDQAKDDKMEGGAMMAADPAKAVFDLSGLAPGVVPFTSEAAAGSLAANKRVVYFFAASWCPTCRETYRDLKEKASMVPGDLVVVVVDYDKESALKAKYGVTYQHTFVSVGPMGESLKKWSGSKSVAEIAANAVMK